MSKKKSVDANVGTIRDLGDRISIFVPLTLRKRSGRKAMVPPGGDGFAEGEPTAWVVMLAKAYVWQKWIDEGKYADAAGVARAVGVDASFVRRVLRWGGISPRIVEEALVGMEPSMSLNELAKCDLPILWPAQEGILAAQGPD